MQGRLVPPEAGRLQCFPREQWRNEFSRASEVPLDYIEWIFDVYGYDANPLVSEDGHRQLKQMMSTAGISIRSVCADYFMDKPFVRCSEADCTERTGELVRIMRTCRVIGVQRIVLPFVDASSMQNERDVSRVIMVLQAVLPEAKSMGLEIHLETDLGPEQFARFLDRVPDPLLKVNYDTGNSASLGYIAKDELAAYGDRIGSVHIKDRVLHGSTVPLGTGNADFEAFFSSLVRSDYKGDFTLQVARGVPGDEVAWARQNLQFVREFLEV